MVQIFLRAPVCSQNGAQGGVLHTLVAGRGLEIRMHRVLHLRFLDGGREFVPLKSASRLGGLTLHEKKTEHILFHTPHHGWNYTWLQSIAWQQSQGASHRPCYGRHGSACRFWTMLSSSDLKSTNSHRDWARSSRGCTSTVRALTGIGRVGVAILDDCRYFLVLVIFVARQVFERRSLAASQSC